MVLLPGWLGLGLDTGLVGFWLLSKTSSFPIPRISLRVFSVIIRNLLCLPVNSMRAPSIENIFGDQIPGPRALFFLAKDDALQRASVTNCRLDVIEGDSVARGSKDG
jgi:hypothetical protein